MKTSDFNFDLPENLIAQHPGEKRGQSRLMTLDRGTGLRGHYMVQDLPSLLETASREAAPLLVFNNTRVRKARLFAVSVSSGAKVEFLLLKKLAGEGHDDGCLWQTMAQRTKRRRIGSRYIFKDAAENEIAHAEISGEDGAFRILCFDRPIDDAWLDRYGHIPLPPYIKREDSPDDSERYQTVYAGVTGSSAAPTAGLHFTKELLGKLTDAGIETAFITLHVGLGTFLPVRAENIEDHKMHEEIFSIDEKTAFQIENARAQGRKIIAVGTTSVRTLESAWDTGSGTLRRGEGSTSIFIYPGYQFKLVDGLFTNFHTPESTLLMLVSAFAANNPGGLDGRKMILESYAEAVEKGYHFFSYGDAMLIR
jgi:S-adenosylmethionine:tRNA ribosyltransferase-isomerase